MKKRTVLLSAFVPVLLSACHMEKKEAAPATSTITNPAPNLTRAKASAQAKTFIVSPKNDEVVTSPVTVKFGAEGITIAKAGVIVDNEAHYHLLIDQTSLPSFEAPLPFTDQILHFGQAQTEATIILEPGTHTLQLLLAGGNHVANDPAVYSEKITITVAHIAQ